MYCISIGATGRCHHPKVKVSCSPARVLFSSQFAELNANTTLEYSALPINVFIIYIFTEHISSGSLNFGKRRAVKQLDHKT